MDREEIARQLEFFREIGISHVDVDDNGISLTAPGHILTLEDIRHDLGDCQRCKLAPTRANIVFGSGNPNADLMFVGEAPGSEEDRQGLPFVGRAGQLLTKIIESIGLERDDVYICNVLKCRPPGNRNPEPEEVDTCSPFLKRQLEAVRPKIVLLSGCVCRRDHAGYESPRYRNCAAASTTSTAFVSSRPFIQPTFYATPRRNARSGKT